MLSAVPSFLVFSEIARNLYFCELHILSYFSHYIKITSRNNVRTTSTITEVVLSLSAIVVVVKKQ